jgi:acyl-coenzyme A synthetase/AMP-(fatty) acid ligase
VTRSSAMRPRPPAEALNGGRMHKGDVGSKALAFVAAQPGSDIDVRALSDHCRKQLAAYKRPTELRVVLDLPRTITRKIGRNALRLT